VPWIRSPETQVPFLLPRSSTDAPRPLTINFAWCRETESASIYTAHRPVAADERLALRHFNRLTAPNQPAHRRTAQPCRFSDDGITDERVANAVQCANKPAFGRRVAQRFAKLRDEYRKACFGNMYVGPQRCVQIFVGDGVGPAPDEDHQQVESFR